jgi:cAMP-dependent protein kinase regulator
MGCGASTSNASDKNAVTSVDSATPEKDDAEKRGVSDASMTTAATTTEGAGLPGEAEAAAEEAETRDSFNAEAAPKAPAATVEDAPAGFKRERRVSRSSESVNPTKVEIVTYPKTEAEKTAIVTFLKESSNFLFKGLTDIRAMMVADAMFKKDVKAGETVIEQGDDGDNFYLIGSGSMEVFVKRDPDSEPMKVLEYAAGGTFGELALMYLCPRAATVKAVSDCMLWCLDRVQFRALMCAADGQQQANSQWVTFLEGVEVFSTLNKFEIMTVADAVQEEDCGEDEMVIEKGDDDAEFMYILESGSCAAILPNEDGGDPVILKEYLPGDYFGELALLEGGPRKASVKVTSEEAHFLKISAENFNGVCAPIHQVMRKNAEAYKPI